VAGAEIPLFMHCVTYTRKHLQRRTISLLECLFMSGLVDGRDTRSTSHPYSIAQTMSFMRPVSLTAIPSSSISTTKKVIIDIQSSFHFPNPVKTCSDDVRACWNIKKYLGLSFLAMYSLLDLLRQKHCVHIAPVFL